MSMDVFSKPGCIPMIVGDAADIADISGIDIDAGKTCLIMRNAEGELHPVALSLDAAVNFATAPYVLVGAMDEANRIVSAYRMTTDSQRTDVDTAEVSAAVETLLGSFDKLIALRDAA